MCGISYSSCSYYVHRGQSEVRTMASLFARHAVRDFEKWLEGHQAINDLRDQHGCISNRIWQSDDTPNDVMTLHEFNSMEEAKAFAASPLLQVAMERAGADYAQRIEYFQEAS